MFKHKKKLLALIAAGVLSVTLYAQTRGTPSQIRVILDSTGALVTAFAEPTPPYTSVQFSNARLLLDATGALVTTGEGGGGFDCSATANGDVLYNNAGNCGGFGDWSGTTLTVGGLISASNYFTDATLFNVIGGNSAGAAITTGNRDTFLGYQAGASVTDGFRNTLVGYGSGNSIIGGDWNTIIGSSAGDDITTGEDNVFIGDSVAADSVTNASGNVIIGSSAAVDFLGGNNNIVIGILAGQDVVSGNVIIGANVAASAGTISNELWIDNSSTATPLIHGDFSTDSLQLNGTVTLNSYLEGTEQSAPSAPAANGFRIYAVDNGGKTQLCALFNSGAAQCFATEP